MNMKVIGALALLVVAIYALGNVKKPDATGPQKATVAAKVEKKTEHKEQAPKAAVSADAAVKKPVMHKRKKPKAAKAPVVSAPGFRSDAVIQH